MKKLIPESLSESMDINEGLLDSIKKYFEKVGKFFVAKLNGVVIPAMPRANIAMLYQDGKLPKSVKIYPSTTSIEQEPLLAGLRTNMISQSKQTSTFGGKLAPKVSESKINEADEIGAHPNKEIVNIKGNELKRRIRMSIRNRKGVPLLIWGAPGIAKTGIVQTVVEAMLDGKGECVEFNLQTMKREDFFMPGTQLDELGRIDDIPKSWLPVYRKTGDPKIDAKSNDTVNNGEGGVIFLDELAAADKGTQAVLLKLVHEKRIGKWWLGDKWTFIAAANREEDNTGIYNMSSPLASRFSQVNLLPDYTAWRNWATGKEEKIERDKNFTAGQWKNMIGKMKVDPRILDFVEFYPDYFYTFKGDDSTVFGSQRTWHAASRNIMDALEDEHDTGERITTSEMTNIIASDIGTGAAVQFMTFMKFLQSFTQEDIKQVLEDPMKAKLPSKAAGSKDSKGLDQAESNALISIVCSYTKDKPISPKQWENYNRYLVRLENPSMAVKGHKLMIHINDMTVDHKSPGHINDQLGCITDGKHSSYCKGHEIFLEKYGDIF